ncbi:MAG: polysaccharide deacetylase family protein [Chloroflexi bacterium]|nr:polysaccharide deacetylase family protein [Chloroflexota bacterium]
MDTQLDKGVFLLSIDTELAWGGVHDGSFRRRSPHYLRTRDVIGRLLRLLDEYEIHATWAVVGHLMLESCKPHGGRKHPEIARPAYSWLRGDWFASDPCANASAAPFWYGPDIVQRILDCGTRQEIGSHGFSHMIVGDPGCSRECFDSELKASREAAKRWGIELKSFVFPRNSIGHLDVLAANGFTSFRGVTKTGYRLLPGTLQRVGRGIENMLPSPAVTAHPRKTGELWDLPATCFYLHRDGWARRAPIAFRVRKSVSGLRKAASERAIHHLWFHPFNLASDPDGLLDGLKAIFAEAARLREQGGLLNPTMGEMAGSLQRASAAS